jgi:hypothetical protein
MPKVFGDGRATVTDLLLNRIKQGFDGLLDMEREIWPCCHELLQILVSGCPVVPI